MNKVVERLRVIVGEENVLVGDGIAEEYRRDEALTVKPCLPEVVVKPGSAEEVAKILSLANEEKVPVTPKGLLRLKGCRRNRPSRHRGSSR